MILLALGANQAGPLGAPLQTLRAVPALLAARGIFVQRGSRIYKTAPLGDGGPDVYHNAVVAVASDLLPLPLLAALQQVERLGGRRRGRRWGARTLDLDLIAYRRICLGWRGAGPAARDLPRPAPRGTLILPHPGMHLRPFVIAPLLDIAPQWHHPVTGETAFTIWRRLKSVASGRILTDCGALLVGGTANGAVR